VCSWTVDSCVFGDLVAWDVAGETMMLEEEEFPESSIHWSDGVDNCRIELTGMRGPIG